MGEVLVSGFKITNKLEKKLTETSLCPYTPQEIPPVPLLTARVASLAFPKGNLYMRLRDELGVFYQDDLFASLYPQRGQSAQAPWQLAMVLVMQFLENLSDRQAAEAVRARIDWKYALSLELTDQDRPQNQDRNQNQERAQNQDRGFGSASTAMSLRDQILEILNRYDTPSLRDAALMDLARLSGYPYREVGRLAKSLAIEVDLQTDQVEAAQKLANLIKTQPAQLNLYRYLEPWFAEILTRTALAMPTAPEFLFTTLLPAAASRVGTAAKVVIKPSAKYAQPLVFWTAIVANSGSMKTPAQRVILDPLVALETAAYESYLQEKADYDAEQDASKGKKSSDKTLEEPSKPPTRKRYLTKDITLETLQRTHGENPRGLLYYRDELAANTKARNQYRGGHGADEEAELDQWNGSAILYDRAEKSVCLPHSAISRTGGYQWEVLAQLMGDHHDFNGNFARWLFCAAKTPPRYLRLLQEEEQDTGISEALTRLYANLEKVTQQDYLLSYEAKQLLEMWQHQLVNAELAEDTFGLQVAFPKIEAYTTRLALWLHIVNAVLRDQKPSQVINGDTMERAIELAAYYLWQYRLIHTYNSPDAGLAALALKVQKFAERVGQATASALKSGIRTLRKMATDQIRQLMQTLANAGYGQIVGEGTQMMYVPVATHGSPTEKERNHATSNGQFVNLATEYAAGAGTGATDRECQLERQLSATRIDIVENNSQSLVSGNGLKSRNSSGEIDTIDAKLTAASIPQTQIMSASQMPVDITDRGKSSQKNTEAANFNAETRVDEFEQVAGDDASLSHPPTHTWSGFKVGDLVRLSYNRTGVNASVIDPAKYPEIGAQPAFDCVPIKPTDTGKPEWYPAAWLY